jgi:hypothetical protein
MAFGTGSLFATARSVAEHARNVRQVIQLSPYDAANCLSQVVKSDKQVKTWKCRGIGRRGVSEM